MLKALRRVEKNKGAPGIDNLTVESLKPYLRQNWLSIREQLLKGEYKPHGFIAGCYKHLPIG